MLKGQQPQGTENLLDTYVDRDASATKSEQASAESTLGGATSGNVHSGLGLPASGMSSKERHHDGQPGRKRNAEGVDQFGPPGLKEKVLGAEEREKEREERGVSGVSER